MFSPNIPNIKEMAYAAATSRKSLYGAAAIVGFSTSYLAYSGRLTSMAIATGQKINALVTGIYALGSKCCIMAAPRAAAALKIIASYTNMMTATPVLLSIAFIASTAFAFAILTRPTQPKQTSVNNAGEGAEQTSVNIPGEAAEQPSVDRANLPMKEWIAVIKATIAAKNKEIEERNQSNKLPV